MLCRSQLKPTPCGPEQQAVLQCYKEHAQVWAAACVAAAARKLGGPYILGGARACPCSLISTPGVIICVNDLCRGPPSPCVNCLICVVCLSLHHAMQDVLACSGLIDAYYACAQQSVASSEKS